MRNKLFIVILLSIIICSTFEHKTRAYPLRANLFATKSLSNLTPVHQCHQKISITNAFARASVGKSKQGSVYMNILSGLDDEIKLIGARTEVSEKASLHNHINNNGVLKMRPIKNISIPARGAVELKPGGYHVMLMGLNTPLIEGTEFKLELIFQEEEMQEVLVQVLSAGAMGKRRQETHAH